MPPRKRPEGPVEVVSTPAADPEVCLLFGVSDY